jgi:hypothetical protein
VAQTGVDVDSGFEHVTPLGDSAFTLCTEKNVRFADISERLTGLQGVTGSGAILSYMAPAIVGLWMNEFTAHLLELERVRQGAGFQAVPATLEGAPPPGVSVPRIQDEGSSQEVHRGEVEQSTGEQR